MLEMHICSAASAASVCLLSSNSSCQHMMRFKAETAVTACGSLHCVSHPKFGLQNGYFWVGACVPAGRITADDFFDFADIAEKCG